MLCTVASTNTFAQLDMQHFLLHIQMAWGQGLRSDTNLLSEERHCQWQLSQSYREGTDVRLAIANQSNETKHMHHVRSNTQSQAKHRYRAAQHRSSVTDDHEAPTNTSKQPAPKPSMGSMTLQQNNSWLWDGILPA